MTIAEILALLATVGGVGGVASSLIKIGETKRELSDLSRRHAELATEYREAKARTDAMMLEHDRAWQGLAKDIGYIRDKIEQLVNSVERSR